jgi:hypothetical protein
MPGSKSAVSKRGKMIMMLAKKYRSQHPGTKWTQCVSQAGKIYKAMENRK